MEPCTRSPGLRRWTAPAKSGTASRPPSASGRALALLAVAAAGCAVGAAWYQRGVMADEAPDYLFGLKRIELGFGLGAIHWPRLRMSIVAAVAAALLGAIWRQARDRRGDDGRWAGRSACWIAVSAVLAMQLVYVLSQMASRASFPTDALLASECPFSQYMLKVRLGLAPYQPAGRNNSMVYNPGAPLLTEGIAALLGRDRDLTFCRLLQLGFLIAACGVGLATALRLARPAGSGTATATASPSPAVVLALGLFLLLAGTNPHTSPFVDLLNIDSLAILTCTLGMAALAWRDGTNPRRWMLMAAPIPALAMVAKQTGGVVWLGLALGLWIQERSVRAAVRFGLISGAWMAAAAAVLCVWSRGWWYFWTVRVLSQQPWDVPFGLKLSASIVVPLTPVLLASVGWLVWAISRRAEGRGRVMLSALLYTALLAGPAAITMLKIGAGAPNHWGPAGLALAIVAAAGAARLVGSAAAPGERLPRRAHLAAAAGILAAAVALHAVPPIYPRYVPGRFEVDFAQRLDRLFHESDPARTLLDHGTWPYLTCGVLPDDRCDSVLETAEGGVRDVFPMIGRISARWYERILVHRFYGEEWYGPDVMRAVNDHYKQIRFEPGGVRVAPFFLMTDVLVYERKSDQEVARLAPRVVCLEPGSGVWTGKSPRQVAVTFSDPMDPATLTTESLVLKSRAPDDLDAPLVKVGATRVRYDEASRTAVIRPPQRLKPGFYVVEVSGDARDARGRKVGGAPFQADFLIAKTRPVPRSALPAPGG